MSLVTEYIRSQFAGGGDPSKQAGWGTPEATTLTGGAPNDVLAERMGFFTDTSICIGCKACEVACKEWNRNPEDGYEFTGYSYDNTGELGADTWRHVAFVEQSGEQIARARESGRKLVDLGMPTLRSASGAGAEAAGGSGEASHLANLPDDAARAIRVAGGHTDYATDAPSALDPGAPALDVERAQVADELAGVNVLDIVATDNGVMPTALHEAQDFRWLMASDVCKHCTHAGCLDNCPTGALFRTEFGTVVVQADVCNGCGYCVGGCPFGVIERREKTATVNHGNAQKCTLCYDRLKEGQTPACAQTCPTTSIKFGTHAEMVAIAEERVAQLHAQGMTEARLYGANLDDGVGGTGSVFLLLDDPEVYGLPPDPVAPSKTLPESYKRMAMAAGGMMAAAALAFVGGGVA